MPAESDHELPARLLDRCRKLKLLKLSRCPGAQPDHANPAMVSGRAFGRTRCSSARRWRFFLHPARVARGQLQEARVFDAAGHLLWSRWSAHGPWSVAIGLLSRSIPPSRRSWRMSGDWRLPQRTSGCEAMYLALGRACRGTRTTSRDSLGAAPVIPFPEWLFNYDALVVPDAEEVPQRAGRAFVIGTYRDVAENSVS